MEGYPNQDNVAGNAQLPVQDAPGMHQGTPELDFQLVNQPSHHYGIPVNEVESQIHDGNAQFAAYVDTDINPETQFAGVMAAQAVVPPPFPIPSQILPSQPVPRMEPARQVAYNFERGSTIPDALSYQENGRTWQNYRPEKYILPNDAPEQDRLDLTHAMFMLCLKGSLYWAPLRVETLSRVLDLGTGTGIWAIDFARQHPETHVTGVDLSLIQPDVTGQVPNVEFHREDVEDEWIFQEPFDFVHTRLMFTCFNSHKDVLQKIYNNLKPGGWFESHECMFNIDADDNTHRGTALHKWSYLAMAGAAATGKDLEAPRKYRDYMTEIGFVDVVERRLKVYGNGWPTDETDRKIGVLSKESGLAVVQNASLRLLQQGLGMEEGEVRSLVAQAVKDVHDTNIHWYWPGYVVYGRKPLDSEILYN